jgi:hypothetical protein
VAKAFSLFNSFVRRIIMSNKLLYLLSFVLMLALASNANFIKPVCGANIAWVSYHAADDEPHADAAAFGFTQAPDKAYTDLLTAQGYNVVRVLTSQTPDVEFLNTMNLVIISRTASSGHYGDSGATLWHSVTAPMINLNGYTLRSSRLGFTDGTDIPDTTGDIRLTVTDPTHPIFAGIALTDGTMDNLYAEGAVPLPTDGVTISRGISINNNNIDDDGTLLATIAEASADTGPVGGMVIAEWPAGSVMQNSTGSPDDVLCGPRLIFLTGSREPDGVTGGQAAALYDLYPDGEQMFLNAVLYMLVETGQSSNPNPADCSLHNETWVNLFWNPGDFAVSHDVFLGDNFDDVNNGTGDTFQSNQDATYFVAGYPGVAYPDGLVPGKTYYWRIDEVNDTDPNSPWKGDVWSFMLPPRTAYAPDPADAADYVDQNLQLSWSSGLGVKLHYVYFGDNFYDVNNASGGSPQGVATYFPAPLRLAHTYYWRVDEFDAIDTYKGDVWSFTTYGAVRKPNPANGAVDVKQTQIITWFPSVSAASHELYFGTDKDSVKNADTASPEYKGTNALGSESYDPGKLEWNVTYYWRIDEVNNTNPDSPWTGILWSFTTANFLVVDDFESYNDIDPPDPGSNRIFESWSDGYEIPTNGALVGNELPPYAETSIVHYGSQSMPYFCDNSFGYSEATLTLTYPRDWTENGVNRLTIWFRGDSANAAETLYIALNDRATVYHDNPNAALIDTWTEWTIDLQAFADQGVNLTNVNSISIGFGDWNNLQPGGSGTMYFDDIRLYRSSEPEPEPLP